MRQPNEQAVAAENSEASARGDAAGRKVRAAAAGEEDRAAEAEIAKVFPMLEIAPSSRGVHSCRYLQPCCRCTTRRAAADHCRPPQVEKHCSSLLSAASKSVAAIMEEAKGSTAGEKARLLALISSMDN